MSTLNQTGKKSKCMRISNLEICDYEKSDFLHLQPTLSINNSPISSEDIPMQKDISAFREFDNLVISEVDHDVGLLIGNDNRHILQPIDTITSTKGYYAIKAPIGWIFNCPGQGSSNDACRNKCFFVKSNPKSTSLCVHFVLMLIDSINSDKVRLSQEQARFMQLVANSVRLRPDQHYEIALPLRYQDISLPNTKVQVEQRADYLKRRFLKNPQFFEDYKCFMSDMIANGFAERVTDTTRKDEQVWYLPHHAVNHPNKPGKLQVVFDCSSKYKGICLNDCPLPGSNITNTLLGVLFRFRCGLYAI